MSLGGKAATVRFEAVSKRYGDVTAVRDVSLAIEAGALVTLLGPSGCGKTTTLRLIAGLEMATAGRILIGDQDVTRLPATKRDVSMVFQSYALFPHMSVFENVAYGLRASRVAKPEIGDRAERGLRLVGLEGFGARLPSELSGGQQQRVAVARALVLEPAVLLFDEPLSNLDAKLRRRVREEIRDLQQSLGLTTIYVTHDQEEALAVSDRIVVMRDAEIAQIGSPRDLYEAPADGFVAGFIGDANIVEGQISAINGDMAVVDIGDALRTLLPHRGLGPGPTRIAVRPHGLRILDDGPGLAAKVTKATYLGDHVEYRLESAIGDLFLIDPRQEVIAGLDETVHLGLSGQGIALLPD